jgi:hypothetical protein
MPVTTASGNVTGGAAVELLVGGAEVEVALELETGIVPVVFAGEGPVPVQPARTATTAARVEFRNFPGEPTSPA